MSAEVRARFKPDLWPVISDQEALRKRRATGVIVIALLLLAIAIRVNYVLPVLVSGVPLDGDALYRYHALAQNLVAGNGFTTDGAPPYQPNSFAQPGYPAFVALLYLLSGGSQKAVVLAQVALELLTLFIVFKMCESLKLSRRVQLTSVAVGSMCPFLVSNSTFLRTEMLATFLITLTCWMLVSALGKEGQPGRRCVFAGLAGGTSLLVRPDSLVAVIAMILVAGIYLIRRDSWVRTGFAMGVFSIAMIAILLPWTLRGFLVFGSFKPLGEVSSLTRLGYVRWLDTWIDNPKDARTYGGEWYKAVPVPREKTDDLEEWTRASQAYGVASLRGFHDVEATETYLALAREAIHKRPFKTLIVVPLVRAAMTWADMPFAGIGVPQRKPAIALTILYWWLLTLLTILGITRAPFLKDSPTGVLLAVLTGRLALPLISSYGAEARYMLEALPVCFVFAAVAVHYLASSAERIISLRRVRLATFD